MGDTVIHFFQVGTITILAQINIALQMRGNRLYGMVRVTVEDGWVKGLITGRNHESEAEG